MRYFGLAIIIVILIIILKKEYNNPNSLSQKEITFNEILYIIEEHKQFELKNNKAFEKTLHENSKKYYLDVTNNFLKKEYSSSGSFKEINIIINKMTETSEARYTLLKKGSKVILNFIRPESNYIDLLKDSTSIRETDKKFKKIILNTNNERFNIWEAKINNYFSSLAYTRFIKAKTDNFSGNVNKQRKKELEDLLNFINEDSLEINKINVDLYASTEATIKQCVKNANKKIKENLKEIVYNTAEAGSLFITVGTSAAVIGGIEGVSASEMVYEFVIPKKDKTREILIKEYSSFLEKNKIEIIELLDKNTYNYYNKLLELVNRRKNEKILL